MMVPRSYSYTTPPRSSSAGRSASSGSSSLSLDRELNQPRASKAKIIPKKSRTNQLKPEWLRSIPAATPSKPVIIPTRTQSMKSRRKGGTASAVAGESRYVHDPNTIPPSMAALLALTSQPHPPGISIRQKGLGRRSDIESLSADDFRYSVSGSSPKSWSILQSPPDTDSDVEGGTEAETDEWSVASDSTVAVSTPFRSLSPDSTPSLETDLECDSSISLSPPTFANRFRSSSRRGKLPSPAIPLANEREHPLSTETYPENPDDSSDKEPFFLSVSEIPASSFKSNLTASLRLLKSAARSLSAPSRFPDPSIVSPYVLASSDLKTTVDFPPEPRFDTNGVSSSRPHLTFPANIDALPFYLSSQLPALPPTASIQLQPYLTSPLSTSCATAPPIFLPASNPAAAVFEVGPRERQQRENSDFLRVVVLEMNMRRVGKLKGDGRARIWLGARREKIDGSDVVSEAGQGIADGGKGSGAVVLDGEVGEAREIDTEEERVQRDALLRGRDRKEKIDLDRRRERNVPNRWIQYVP